jgi:1-deoxy-D-xylulose-5-phosphate reductoisomerase|tara:strand:- start:2739 stop:3911 length:1173 start_codon:yes stop_codon:yes gene_type:complete
MSKTISIIGSTGSIGLSTLSIINKKNFSINLLSANKNYKLICAQIIKYKPKFFIITDKTIFKKTKKKFKKKKTKLLNNFNSIKDIKKTDITIAAIPGISGLEPTIKMISKSRKILLANKESIICGWQLIKKEAKKNKTLLVPVDSEHYSILKLLENKNIKDIKKIYITASGGPFLKYKINQLKKVTPQEALRHPKWKMGKKISIDSSTLMNKIFELVEAQKLFDIPISKLDILIHPNSLIHAIIKLNNGLSIFIYHETTMKIPLANAIFDGKLNIEDFHKNKKETKIEFENLRFEEVNPKIFPTISLKKIANKYPSTPIIINSCNEVLVDQFLRENIPFLSIYKIIMTILKDRNFKKYAIRNPKNISEIYKINNWARKKTLEKISKIRND